MNKLRCMIASLRQVHRIFQSAIIEDWFSCKTCLGVRRHRRLGRPRFSAHNNARAFAQRSNNQDRRLAAGLGNFALHRRRVRAKPGEYRLKPTPRDLAEPRGIMCVDALVPTGHSLTARRKQLARLLLPSVQRLGLLTLQQALIRGYITGFTVGSPALTPRRPAVRRGPATDRVPRFLTLPLPIC
jgi:hypothetical protein